MRRIVIGLALIGSGLVAGVVLQRALDSRLVHKPAVVAATNAPSVPIPAKLNGPILTPDQIETALADLGKMSPGYEKQVAADAFAARLSTNAIPIAAARAAQPELRLEPFVLIKICARWATVDPEAAGKFIVTQPPSEYRDKELRNLIEVWSHENVETLITWVEQNSAPDVQHIAFPKLAVQLANTQPARAASIASRISSSIERQLVLKTVYDRWIQIDPAAASKKLLAVFIPEVPGEDYLREALAAWFARDATAAFESLKVAPDNLVRRHAIMDTAEIMGGIDPTNVLGLILTMPHEDSKRLVAMGSLAKTWTSRDPHAAWNWAQSVQDAKEHDMAMQEVLIALQDRDPELAREFVRNKPEAPGAGLVAGNLAQHWAEKSPREAFAWANQLSATNTRANAVRGVFQGWMRQSYPEAAKAAAELLSGSERQSVLACIFQSWTLTDAREAAQFLVKSPLGEEDASIYASITDMLLNNSLTNTVAWASQLPVGKPRVEVERKISTFLSRTDPARAAQFLEKIPNPDAIELVEALMSVWARHDLGAASAWIDHLSNAELQTASRSALARQAARTEPVTAARLAEKTLPDQKAPGLRFEIADSWADSNPAAAVGWLLQQGTNVIQPNAVLILASKWASKEPEEAAAFVLTLPENSPRQIWLDSTVARWTRRDPEAAANWALNKVPEKSRTELLRTVAEIWVPYDSGKAAAWAKSRQPSAARDEALSAVVAALTDSNPSAAAELAQSITNANLRWTAFESLAPAWLRADPGRAREWLRTNSLPMERKQRLIDR